MHLKSLSDGVKLGYALNSVTERDNMTNRTKISALILVLILTQTACSSLAGRVAKSVSAIPSVVRVLFPNASPTVFTVLDAASKAFKEFTENKTVGNWERAENVWNQAKPLLAGLNNGTINKIVAAVDVLIGQVTLPVGVAGSGGGGDTTSNKVLVRFEEDDVEELEKLIESVK